MTFNRFNNSRIECKQQLYVGCNVCNKPIKLDLIDLTDFEVTIAVSLHNHVEELVVTLLGPTKYCCDKCKIVDKL